MCSSDLPAALTAGVGQGVGHVAATHKGHRSRTRPFPGAQSEATAIVSCP